jgi:hypothetical protein
MKNTPHPTRRPWIATLALLTILVPGCGRQNSDPLLAAGEQAIVGVYKLDNVLLGPGRLVRLHPVDPMFEGIGDTLEQAVHKGLFTPAQVATLQQEDCSLQFLTNHTFAVSNLPAADFSSSILITGSWSLSVYHVFETYGYRISMKGEPKGGLALAKFINSDKPEPPVIEILYQEGEIGQVTFRFARTNRPSLPLLPR